MQVLFFFSSVNIFLHNYVFLELMPACHLLATHIFYMIILTIFFLFFAKEGKQTPPHTQPAKKKGKQRFIFEL